MGHRALHRLASGGNALSLAAAGGVAPEDLEDPLLFELVKKGGRQHIIQKLFESNCASIFDLGLGARTLCHCWEKSQARQQTCLPYISRLLHHSQPIYVFLVHFGNWSRLHMPA